ncbi:hypothetical protein ACEPAH_4186 [Sanghuangporus vaninii]
MAITELVTLSIRSGKDRKDILPHICTVDVEQAAWSGYPLHFFDCVGKPGEIVLLSGWKNVDAYSEWIAGETNQRLLRLLQSCLDVKNLLRLTIEPSLLQSAKKGKVPGFLHIECARYGNTFVSWERYSDPDAVER